PRTPWTPAPPATCWTAGSKPVTAWTPRAADPASGVGAQAEGERGLQVVPGVGTERDVRLGVRAAGDLVQPAGDDVGEFLMAADPDHGYQVELSGDRVHLADLGDLGDHLGHLGNALNVGSHQDDRGDHWTPPRLSWPGSHGWRLRYYVRPGSELIQGPDPVVGQPPDQPAEHVCGGTRVGQRAVRRRRAGPEEPGQRAQLAVWDFVRVHQVPGQHHRVKHGAARPGQPALGTRGAQEADVERRV